MATQVLMVADDLTGALDSAVALAARGLSTVVARRPSDLPEALAREPDVIAVSTASREGTAAEAEQSVAAALAPFGPQLPPIVFKKVDSRLKGHVAAETAVVLKAAGAEEILFCPAIPDMGRIVRAGQLSGMGIAKPIALADVMAGLPARLVMPDCESEGELDAAVAGMGPRALLAGARGLAGALARRLAPNAATARRPRVERPLLLAVGSRDPISLAQVAVLLDTCGIPCIDAPDGAVPPAALPRESTVLVRMVPGPGASPGAAGERFAQGLRTAVSSFAPRTLFACGGETADALLGELGVGVLALEGEVLAGVPVSHFSFGGADMRLVTKSGGFGPSELLLSLVAMIESGRQLDLLSGDRNRV